MKKRRSVLALLLVAALNCCTWRMPGWQGWESDSSDTTSSQVSTESTPTGEPVMGGSITVGIPQDIEDSLDPHKSVAAGTKEILFNIYEGLVKPDEEGNLNDAVAESPFDLGGWKGLYLQAPEWCQIPRWNDRHCRGCKIFNRTLCGYQRRRNASGRGIFNVDKVEIPDESTDRHLFKRGRHRVSCLSDGGDCT